MYGSTDLAGQTVKVTGPGWIYDLMYCNVEMGWE